MVHLNIDAVDRARMKDYEAGGQNCGAGENFFQKWPGLLGDAKPWPLSSWLSPRRRRIAFIVIHCCQLEPIVGMSRLGLNQVFR
jgi:hypothetical protein